MSAIEETGTAGPAKSTRGGSRPSVGEATQALMYFPHLPYGDAVFAEIVAGDPHPPTLIEAGVGHSEERVLFLRVVWVPGHPGLGAGVRADGLTLRWSPVVGWSAHTLYDSRRLLIDELAAPTVLADAALHLCEHGLDCEWEPEDRLARWEFALELDIALVTFDERGPS
ncbi:hypothetical protein [Streptomyces sp. NPDC005423]|uniref:hypothetical protein n=1 Tax=Streptomyces sp. NPDC005423 TaxID=3155343 RepID=UPI00339F3A91